jgi:hypothetical protein
MREVDSSRDDSVLKGIMGRKKRRFENKIFIIVKNPARIAASSFPDNPKKRVIPNPPDGG